ncbi:hypothetical protein TOPH_02250 [Tolypocladium ophioglossoides CBS 100239]|uniref:Uncharacterized protein n=1 Tax=Tolypocladium ophioglossoides (strain CBS 100239) TaxID=1163406 RepID=A0A0L0NGV8_TOLOC|nr:hypothetical protein TOPH_02250 [Tolypocladium ophioglossoides CBS 100239]
MRWATSRHYGVHLKRRRQVFRLAWRILLDDGFIGLMRPTHLSAPPSPPRPTTPSSVACSCSLKLQPCQEQTDASADVVADRSTDAASFGQGGT